MSDARGHTRRQRVGILCGIMGPLLWLLLIGVAAAMRPEFSFVNHYISELGERGSSTEWLMRVVAFGFTGLLYLCFASVLPALLRGGWGVMLVALLIALDGVGRMGAGMFPCDPGCSGFSSGQELHRQFATLGFVSGLLAALAWGIVCLRRGGALLLGWYSVGSGVLTTFLLLLMSWEQNPLNVPGLYEHLATLVLSLWLPVFAWYLLRHSGGPGKY